MRRLTQIYAHVKSNFANNVLVRLLHELPGMPPVFAVEPANESYSKPPRALHAATLQSVKRLLKPQRKAFTFADEYTRQLQDEDDYDLVAPPVGLARPPAAPAPSHPLAHASSRADSARRRRARAHLHGPSRVRSSTRPSAPSSTRSASPSSSPPSRPSSRPLRRLRSAWA